MARASRAMKSREAHNAQQRVWDAIDRGEIKKPSACQKCGKRTDQLEFAHSNYNGRLDGKWLCSTCHHAWDHGKPKGGGSGSMGTERA